MRLALYQPDIPQNTGAILRTAVCLDVSVDIIGPVGFDLSGRALRRAGLDYVHEQAFTLHTDFDAFMQARVETARARGGRLALATTKAADSYLAHRFAPHDIILMGRESAGVPPEVHATADIRLKIPLQTNARSLNLSVSSAIILSEALRQTNGFPEM